MKPSIRVIVNADDYGYFACVSRGILACHRDGLVTATGVMANGPRFDETVAWLAQAPELDLGVHLNLSLGRPLTAALAAAPGLRDGAFDGKFAALAAVAGGRWSLGQVAAEWRAQIERCRTAGLRLRFLNSHEHVHMWPALWRVARALGDEFGIPHLRRVRPEWQGTQGWLRNLALGLMSMWVPDAAEPRFLGLAASGRLDEAAVRRALGGLAAGGVYELMCHPGDDDATELDAPHLRTYHAWTLERQTLCAPGLRAWCAERGIVPCGYRDLDPGRW